MIQYYIRLNLEIINSQIIQVANIIINNKRQAVDRMIKEEGIICQNLHNYQQIDKQAQTKEIRQIRAAVTEIGLQVHVKIMDKNTRRIQQFSGILGSLQQQLNGKQQLCDYFENLHELQAYIQDATNLQLGQNGTTLKIISKISTKKKRYIELAEITLKPLTRTTRIRNRIKQISKIYHIEEIGQVKYELQTSQRQQHKNRQIITHILDILSEMVDIDQDKSSSSTNHSKCNSNQIQYTQLKSKIEQVQSQVTQIKAGINQQSRQLRDQLTKHQHHINELVQSSKYDRPHSLQHDIQDSCQQSQEHVEQEKHPQVMSNLRSHSKEISAIDRKGVSGRRKLKLKLKTSKISSKHKNIMKRAMYGPKQRIKNKQSRCAKNWVNPQCISFNQIKFNKMRPAVVSCLGPANIFSNITIRRNPTFTIKVNKICAAMGLGFIDCKLHRKQQLKDEQNWVTYWNDKECWDGKNQKFQGLGFQAGDIVSVQANLHNGQVIWRVNSCITCKAYNQNITNKQIEWVPYIFLWQKSSQVQILNIQKDVSIN